MKEHRIKTLEKYIAEDPNDTFSIYALAIELQDMDKKRTATLFDCLLENHPSYEGTYYHAAAFFTELGDRQKASTVYESGLKLLQSKNQKLFQELQNAYQNFLFEDD